MISENLRKAKEALDKLDVKERYALSQFMALHEPCDMHLQDIYECLDYADVHSTDGKPQEFEVHLGMCLKPIMIKVNFELDDDGETWNLKEFDFIEDSKWQIKKQN